MYNLFSATIYTILQSIEAGQKPEDWHFKKGKLRWTLPMPTLTECKAELWILLYDIFWKNMSFDQNSVIIDLKNKDRFENYDNFLNWIVS